MPECRCSRDVWKYCVAPEKCESQRARIYHAVSASHTAKAIRFMPRNAPIEQWHKFRIWYTAWACAIEHEFAEQSRQRPSSMPMNVTRNTGTNRHPLR